MSKMPAYLRDVPTTAQFQERLRERIDYWQPRNKFIERARTMLAGRNAVRGPRSAAGYQVKTMHTFMLSAAVNEKKARFAKLPTIKVWPSGISMAAQSAATELEEAFNSSFYELERNSGGDVWDRVVEDAIYLDEGCECIERAPAAFWPSIVASGGQKSDLEFVFEGRSDEEFNKARELYKQQAGIPFRARYVPLESVFPVFENGVPVEVFELEKRSLRSVLSNDGFSPEARALLGQSLQKERADGVGVDVTIVRYSNMWSYAYWALAPTKVGGSWPSAKTSQEIGTPVLLHKYEHELGTVLYNFVPGRFGGWRTNRAGIEPIGNALLELNQHADDISSQILTNVRANYWPNLKWVLNPEFRPPDNGGRPRPPQLEDGQPIALYVGEDLLPVFVPLQNPMAQWLYQEIGTQFNRLSGSPVVYGEREAGVSTGYHQNLQLTQAEHLDEKLEQNISSGGERRALLIGLHTIAMDEDVPVAKAVTDKQTRRNYVAFATLSPSKLKPFPRLDARIKKPRPVDFLAMIRAARDASANRRGEGTPMLSDQTIYDTILGIEDGDMEMRRIWQQNEQQKLLNSDFFTNRLVRRLSLIEVTEGLPAGTQEGAADPALEQAIALQKQGGASGSATGQQFADAGPRRQGGTPFGAPQPEQQIGNAVAGAIPMGAM